MRPAVERVDALVVPESDLRQHRPRAHALGPDFADGLLDLLGEERAVDFPGRKELLDELLVLAAEAIRVLIGQAREFAAQSFPQRAATLFLEAGEQLPQEAVAGTRPGPGGA